MTLGQTLRREPDIPNFLARICRRPVHPRLDSHPSEKVTEVSVSPLHRFERTP
jgi:hypothetical protein